MKATSLNLAARPFANERPVARVAVILWSLGLLLMVINVVLYQSHAAGQQAQRTARSELEQQYSTEQQRVDQLSEALGELNLSAQNEQVDFLNLEIARRTFAWSHLFDRLTEVLPESVQLRRVSPSVADKKLKGRTVDLAEAPVGIQITAVAKQNEAALQLVDALFAHPSFAAPNLINEWEPENNQFEFALHVIYLPAVEVESGQSEESADTMEIPDLGGSDS